MRNKPVALGWKMARRGAKKGKSKWELSRSSYYKGVRLTRAAESRKYVPNGKIKYQGIQIPDPMQAYGVRVGYYAGKNPYRVFGGAGVGGATMLGAGGMLMREKQRKKSELPMYIQRMIWEQEHGKASMRGFESPDTRAFGKSTAIFRTIARPRRLGWYTRARRRFAFGRRLGAARGTPKEWKMKDVKRAAKYYSGGKVKVPLSVQAGYYASPEPHLRRAVRAVEPYAGKVRDTLIAHPSLVLPAMIAPVAAAYTAEYYHGKRLGRKYRKLGKEPPYGKVGFLWGIGGIAGAEKGYGAEKVSKVTTQRKGRSPFEPKNPRGVGSLGKIPKGQRMRRKPRQVPIYGNKYDVSVNKIDIGSLEEIGIKIAHRIRDLGRRLAVDRSYVNRLMANPEVRRVVITSAIMGAIPAILILRAWTGRKRPPKGQRIVPPPIPYSRFPGAYERQAVLAPGRTSQFGIKAFTEQPWWNR